MPSSRLASFWRSSMPLPRPRKGHRPDWDQPNHDRAHRCRVPSGPKCRARSVGRGDQDHHDGDREAGERQTLSSAGHILSAPHSHSGLPNLEISRPRPGPPGHGGEIEFEASTGLPGQAVQGRPGGAVLVGGLREAQAGEALGDQPSRGGGEAAAAGRRGGRGRPGREGVRGRRRTRSETAAPDANGANGVAPPRLPCRTTPRCSAPTCDRSTRTHAPEIRSVDNGSQARDWRPKPGSRGFAPDTTITWPTGGCS